MEKQVYVAPQMELVVLTPLHMLSASIAFGTDEADAAESLANGRRGTWGNRWAD